MIRNKSSSSNCLQKFVFNLSFIFFFTMTLRYFCTVITSNRMKSVCAPLHVLFFRFFAQLVASHALRMSALAQAALSILTRAFHGMAALKSVKEIRLYGTTCPATSVISTVLPPKICSGRPRPRWWRGGLFWVCSGCRRCGPLRRNVRRSWWQQYC